MLLKSKLDIELFCSSGTPWHHGGGGVGVPNAGIAATHPSLDFITGQFNIYKGYLAISILFTV